MANTLRDGVSVPESLSEAQRVVDAVVQKIYGDMEEDEHIGACLGWYDAQLIPKEQASIAIKIYDVMLHLWQGSQDFCQMHALFEDQYFIVHFRDVETQGHSVVNKVDYVEFYTGENDGEVRVFDFDELRQITEL